MDRLDVFLPVGQRFFERHGGHIHTFDKDAVKERVAVHHGALVLKTPVFGKLPTAQGEQDHDQPRQGQDDAHLPAAALQKELLCLKVTGAAAFGRGLARRGRDGANALGRL